MKLHIHVASGKDREEGLALSLHSGLAQHGDTVEVSLTADFATIDAEADIGAVFGLKGKSSEIMQAYRDAGKHTIMFDKALIRVPDAPHKHLRICIDGDSPMKYMMREMRSFERWERLRLPLHPRRTPSFKAPIVLALSSQKYCAYHGLGDATEYAKSVVAQIRQYVKKIEIVYRPKPSWHDFVPVEGTRLSRPPEYLPRMLENAYCLVTHGSSAAIDAVLSGVPAITLGECAATPVSATGMEALRDLFFPSELARWQWAANLAWCQFSVPELQSGEAWGFIRKEVEALDGVGSGLHAKNG